MADDTVAHKTCTKCSALKPFSAYAAQKHGLYGLRGECRVCYNERRRTFYAANSDAKNEKRREYEARVRVREKRIELRRTPERRAKERETMIRYKAKPDVVKQIRAYRERYESTPHVRARIVFRAAETRARDQGLPFTITQEWVLERLLAGCAVTGIPFDLGKPKCGTRRNPFCPSVDQITAGMGYTTENSRVVLVAINLALCDWGLEQFLMLARHAIEYNEAKERRPQSA
jgi:hypothetical protein